MNTLLQDLRYACRKLAQAPAFAVITVVTLALGIGANTTLFTLVNGVLLNPLPYPHPDRIVAVYQTSRGFDKAPTAYLNFLDWERDTRVFSAMGMYRNQDYNFVGRGEGQRVSGYMISANFLTALGVQPILGRTFRAADDQEGAAPVVLLGGAFWSREFGSSPAVIGSSIALSGTSFTIVGVIPASFSFYGQNRDVYTPIGQWNDPTFRDRRLVHSSRVIARLKPGFTIAQARVDMNRIGRNLSRAYPDADAGLGTAVIPMKEDLVGAVRPTLYVLLAATGFLLLIACTNVANLLLARSIGRGREFAIRAALGASDGRLIRQLLTESVLLSTLGAGLGIALAWYALKTAVGILPETVPRALEVTIDAPVVVFTVVVSLVTGILFGLMPAFKSSRVSVQDLLKRSGPGSSSARHRLQGVFVAAEVALALMLLVGAGLMIRTIAALSRVDPGFNPDHAVTFSVSMPPLPHPTIERNHALLRELDRKMEAVPGVEAVSVTLGSRPMIHDSTEAFWIDGQPRPANINEMEQALFYLAEEGFRKAMGISMVRGRFITNADNEHAPIVVVIDDVFARMYFPHEDPIGKRIHLAGFGVEATIVGVVGHLRQWGVDADASSAIEAQFYYPFIQVPAKLLPPDSAVVAVVLRVRGDPVSAMTQIREAVHELDGRNVIYNVQSMDHVISTSFAARTLSMILLSVFAALALILACVGIYGAISYLVGQRTHEIGVRVALGAQRGDVLRLVVGHGTAMALAGIGAGIAGALLLTRLMSHQLFGVTARDPLTFLAVAVLLFVVAVTACYVPARRAMKVDPIIALRQE